jgi:hypothetical protein
MTMQHQATDFFPVHDLTHYAVETVLGHSRGFFGLVADGWNLTDFGTPWPRGRLPADQDPSELIVNALSLERNTRQRTSAVELQSTIDQWYAQNLPQQPVPTAPTDEQLEEVRHAITQLHQRWRELQQGNTLELQFPAEEANGLKRGT